MSPTDDRGEERDADAPARRKKRKKKKKRATSRKASAAPPEPKRRVATGVALAVAAIIMAVSFAQGRPDAGAAIVAASAVTAGLALGVIRLLRLLFRGAEVEPKAPPFAADYPDDPEIARLVEAFRHGNHALVRREASRLADRSEDERVSQAAQDLQRRVQPDPTAVYLLGIGVALVVMLYGYYLSHAH